MAKEIIGFICCPICKNENATVHVESRKRAKKYYRCYTEIGGMTMRCGTIQCRGDAGQTFIEQNMRDKESLAIAKNNDSPPPKVAIATETKKPSFFDNFFSEE